MPWKKDTVADLVSLLKSGDTIAVIDIHGVPAGAMIGMRKDLRGSMKIQVAKKRLMKIAWEQCGFKADDLEALYKSAVQPALSFHRKHELIWFVYRTEENRSR